MKIIDSTNAFKINLDASKASFKDAAGFKAYTSILARIIFAVAEFFHCPLVKVVDTEGKTKFYAFRSAFQAGTGLKNGFSEADVKALISQVKAKDSSSSSSSEAVPVVVKPANAVVVDTPEKPEPTPLPVVSAAVEDPVPVAPAPVVEAPVVEAPVVAAPVVAAPVVAAPAVATTEGQVNKA